mmetsp:Transcript_2920/g.5470  ORF Transcript_2920/g.5470 Transcript_2920/m.5470 type:complete len:694 (+) Transcript_2920:79-2160(+)
MDFSKQLANLQKTVSLSRQQQNKRQSQGNNHNDHTNTTSQGDGGARNPSTLLTDNYSSSTGGNYGAHNGLSGEVAVNHNNHHHSHSHSQNHHYHRESRQREQRPINTTRRDYNNDNDHYNHTRFSTGSRSRGTTGYHPYPSHNPQYSDRKRSSHWNSSSSSHNHHHQHQYHQQHQHHHHPSKKRRHYLTPSEEQFYLPKLVNAIPKYDPLPIQTNNPNNFKKQNKQRHVCLLFLIIDDLPLETLWKAFFDSQQLKNSDMMVSVICHAKYPERVQSPWLKKRLMTLKPSVWEVEQYKERRYKRDSCGNDDNNNNDDDDDDDQSHLPPIRYFSRRPEWGSIEITRAMIDLLEEGLRIGTSRDNLDSISRTIKDPRQASEYRERYSSQRYTINKPSLQNGEVLPTVDRFVFVSETCLPVVTMSELEVSLFGKIQRKEELSLFGMDGSAGGSLDAPGDSLFVSSPQYSGQDANKSWVNARNTPNNGYARQLQWDAMDPAIPSMHIWKADQWILLTRHHAWPMISLLEEAVQNVQASFNTRGSDDNEGRYKRDGLHLGLWQCFRNVKASDEMYFPTLMSLLGILEGGDCEENIENMNTKDSRIEHANGSTCVNEKEACIKRVTYCDWSENAKNPATFTIRRKDNFKEFKKVIKLAREEGCLFARKFTMPEDDLNEADPSEKVNISTGEDWLNLVKACN